MSLGQQTNCFSILINVSTFYSFRTIRIMFRHLSLVFSVVSAKIFRESFEETVCNLIAIFSSRQITERFKASRCIFTMTPTRLPTIGPGTRTSTDSSENAQLSSESLMRCHRRTKEGSNHHVPIEVGSCCRLLIMDLHVPSQFNMWAQRKVFAIWMKIVFILMCFHLM